MNLAETTQLNLQKELHRQRYEDLQHRQGGKASTRPTNNDGKESVRRELRPATAAAKHPPVKSSGKVSANEEKGGKASTNRRPTRLGRCREN